VTATLLVAGCYVVTEPDWKDETPKGIKFSSETQFLATIYRTQLFGPSDMPNVKKIQAGYEVQPLSQFLKQPAPPAAPAIDFPPFTKDDMKLPFPKVLNFILQFCPPVEEEKALRAKFAEVGIDAGKPFELRNLLEAQKGELALGLKDGYDSIEKQRDNIGKNINGWLVGSGFGDRALFHGDWLLHAAAALAGIYGNSAEEAVYPIAKNDNAGAALDGSKHNYTVTFALVIGQVFYLLNSRYKVGSSLSLKAHLGNKYLPLGIGAIVVLQLLFTYAPPFQTLFDTESIPLRIWPKLVLGGFIFFLLVEVEKIIVRMMHRTRAAPIHSESAA